MTDERCQQYLEDPEANAAHLSECDACGLLAVTLAESVPADLSSEVDADKLPLAPWEGASHRPWPLVLSLAIGVVVVTIPGCAPACVRSDHFVDNCE